VEGQGFAKAGRGKTSFYFFNIIIVTSNMVSFDINVEEILGFIFIAAGIAIFLMNAVGVLEGIAALALILIGLYFTGFLK